jgi:hypothetical protein
MYDQFLRLMKRSRTAHHIHRQTVAAKHRLAAISQSADRGRLFFLAHGDISPQCLDVVAREQVAPGRHLVLAVGHDERMPALSMRS